MQRLYHAILLFLYVSPALFSQSTRPDLWNTAVNILADNLNWVPGEMTMQFEMLDKKGHADMVNVSTYKIYADENGDVHSELVKMLNDGEDVTEKEKAKAEKSEKDKNDGPGDMEHSMSWMDSPFHPDNQDAIQLTPLEKEETIEGKRCRRFDYTLPRSESTRIGTVWVDVETGAPLRHEFTTDPLPPRVKKLTNIVIYEYTADGAFYTKQAMFEGVGGILFIKKRFRGTMTFKDYWYHEEKKENRTDHSAGI